MTPSRYATAAAMAVLCAQPCLAADDMRSTGAGERRSGAFAGMAVRLPMGTRHREAPTARLQLTTFHDYRDSSGATVRSYRPRGVELGFERGRATYLVGGQDVLDIEKKLHAKGSTTTWLLVGGALVLTLLVLNAVADAQPTAGPREGAF